MPHLDARALTEDPTGMEFLASVLDLPEERPVRRFGSVEPVQIAETTASVFQIVQPRKRKLVPEAA